MVHDHTVAGPLLSERFAHHAVVTTNHGPFTADAPAARLGLGVAVVERVLKQMETDGRVVQGEFRPAGAGLEWVASSLSTSMLLSEVKVSTRRISDLI